QHRHRRPWSHWRGRHLVQIGDTLSELALRYGTTVHRLARGNRLRVSGYLLLGTVLRYPRHGLRHRHGGGPASPGGVRDILSSGATSGWRSPPTTRGRPRCAGSGSCQAAASTSTTCSTCGDASRSV